MLWPKKNPEKLYAIALTRAPMLVTPRLRASAYVDSPASRTWNAMKASAAAVSGKVVNTSIAGRYAHPDSGSPANGVPAN